MLKRLLIVIVVCVITLGATVLISKSAAQKLEYREAGTREYNWQGAYAFCEREGGRLPTVFELTGLLFSDALTIEHTDYWSRTAFWGYAFGVNTKSNILSFDRFEDIDHVVCVRD